MTVPVRPGRLGPVTRVGHKGAAAVAPGNTIASFEAALGLGVDMIEFDVLPLADGRLVLAHDDREAGGSTLLGLHEGLDHLAGAEYAGLGFDVDLKLPGYEREVIAALRERQLTERVLVSTTFPESLARLGALAPGVARGWSVPRARRDYTRSRLAAAPAYAVLRMMRRRLPGRARLMLEAGRCEAIMAYWRLVDPALLSAVHGAGGRLFAWTVDEAPRIAALEKLGVDGVITNDPGLFSPRLSTV